MEYKMGLYKEPFDSIKTGKKTVEVRLFDEKRRKLNIGDTITFTKVPGNSETLTVEITEITVYPSFRKMYESIPATDFDASGDFIDEMVENTYEIYTPENEKKCGTVAIRVKLLKKQLK
jgi:ASC-1-like (ASCH) protein